MTDSRFSFVYLASPYYHADPKIRESRHQTAVRVAGEFMLCGIPVFSPIAHSHPVAAQLAAAGNLPEGPAAHGFWMAQDLPLLSCASLLFVLQLPGWDVSKGVSEELHWARIWDIPVVMSGTKLPTLAATDPAAAREEIYLRLPK